MQVVRLGLVPGGERLPAERELAERLGISRVTLREVLKVLQDQGLIEAPARAVRRDVRAAARRHPGRGRAAPPPEGHRRRGHPALPRGAGGGRGGIVRGTRSDQRRGRADCGRPWRARTTRRSRSTAAWTPSCTSPSPSCPAPRRSPASTRPSAPGSTTCSTASRCWYGTWSTPSSSTRPWWRPFSTRTPRPRGRSCGSTAPVRRPCCAASSGEAAHPDEHVRPGMSTIYARLTQGYCFSATRPTKVWIHSFEWGECAMSLKATDTADAADDYLERRTLRRGSAGWVLLTGLGVAYVVSGDFSGWNLGLARAASAVWRSPRCSWAPCTPAWSSPSPNSPRSCPRRAAATASHAGRSARGAAS